MYVWKICSATIKKKYRLESCHQWHHKLCLDAYAHCPAPADSLPMHVGMYPAQLLHKGAALYLAIPWMMDISSPLLTVHQVETHDISNWETYFSCWTTNHFIWWQQQKCGALGRSPDGMQSGWQTLPRFLTLIPKHQQIPPSWSSPRTACVWLNHLHTGVRCFHYCLHTCGMGFSAACVRHAKEKAIEQFIIHCPIHPPLFKPFFRWRGNPFNH